MVKPLIFGDSSFPNIPANFQLNLLTRGAEVEVAIEKASKNPNTESQEFLGDNQARGTKKTWKNTSPKKGIVQ